MLWELRVKAEDTQASGGIWYFDKRPTDLQVKKMICSVGGDGEENHSLRQVPLEGQTTTPLPR